MGMQCRLITQKSTLVVMVNSILYLRWIVLKRRHSNSRAHRDLRSHPAHLQWLRGFPCIINNQECDGKIQAAHVDYAGFGAERKATGMKVPDWLAVPCCAYHHARQHTIGWKTFESRYSINAEQIANDLARCSPRAQEMREARKQLMEARHG